MSHQFCVTSATKAPFTPYCPAPAASFEPTPPVTSPKTGAPLPGCFRLNLPAAAFRGPPRWRTFYQSPLTALSQAYQWWVCGWVAGEGRHNPRLLAVSLRASVCLGGLQPNCCSVQCSKCPSSHACMGVNLLVQRFVLLNPCMSKLTGLLYPTTGMQVWQVKTYRWTAALTTQEPGPSMQLRFFILMHFS
jgi:hypothetical protein